MVSTAGGVGVEVEGGVAVVTIDRPDVRNAIGFATADELDAALDRLVASDASVLVLRGGGDRVRVGRRPQGAQRGSHARRCRRHGEAGAAAARPGRRLPGAGHRRAQRARSAAAPRSPSRPTSASPRTTSRSASTRCRSASCRPGAAPSASRRPSDGAARCWRSRPASSTTPRPRIGWASSTSWCRARSSTRSGGRSLAGSRRSRPARRAVKAVVASAVPSVHPDLEADATDAFARLWTADAHWDLVDGLQQRRERAHRP